MTRHEEAARGIERPDLFEAQDVSANGVIIFLGGLIGSLLVIFLLVWGMWGVYVRLLATTGPGPVPALSQVPPEPRVQAPPWIQTITGRCSEAERAAVHTLR